MSDAIEPQLGDALAKIINDRGMNLQPVDALLLLDRVMAVLAEQSTIEVLQWADGLWHDSEWEMRGTIEQPGRYALVRLEDE